MKSFRLLPTFLMIALLTLVLPFAFAGKVEEGEKSPIELGNALTAKLDQLAELRGKLDGETQELSASIDAVSALVDWLANGNDAFLEAVAGTSGVRKVEQLESAVQDASRETDKLSIDKSTPKLVVIALQKVDRSGREVASILGSTH